MPKKIINKFLEPEELKVLFKLYKSSQEIANFLKVSVPTVKRAKKIAGITREDYEHFATGKPSWNSGTAYEQSCFECGAHFKAPRNKKRKYCSRECTAKMLSRLNSDGRLKGSKNPNFGNGNALAKSWKEGLFDSRQTSDKTFTKGKITKYKGISFRSSWEAEFAKELDSYDYTWYFEQTRFVLSDGKLYVPDFYVDELDQFVEVKGYWWPKAKAKFEKFRQEYPYVNIVVKGEDWWNSRK